MGKPGIFPAMVVAAPAKEESSILKIAKKHKVKAQVIGSVIKEPGVYLGDGTRLDYQL